MPRIWPAAAHEVDRTRKWLLATTIGLAVVAILAVISQYVIFSRSDRVADLFECYTTPGTSCTEQIENATKAEREQAEKYLFDLHVAVAECDSAPNIRACVTSRLAATP